MLTPGIAAQVPAPYLALHPDDVEALGIGSGDQVELKVGGTVYRLPVLPKPELPRGLAGLPAGLPGLAGMTLPAWSKSSKRQVVLTVQHGQELS